MQDDVEAGRRVQRGRSKDERGRQPTSCDRWTPRLARVRVVNHAARVAASCAARTAARRPRTQQRLRVLDGEHHPAQQQAAALGRGEVARGDAARRGDGRERDRARDREVEALGEARHRHEHAPVAQRAHLRRDALLLVPEDERDARRRPRGAADRARRAPVELVARRRAVGEVCRDDLAAPRRAAPRPRRPRSRARAA